MSYRQKMNPRRDRKMFSRLADKQHKRNRPTMGRGGRNLR